MPGSGWLFEAGRWVPVERGWNDVLVWWSVAAFKISFGSFHPISEISYPDLSYRRYLDHIRQANICKIHIASHSTTYLPITSSLLPLTKASVLQSCDRIQICSVRLSLRRFRRVLYASYPLYD